jgi:pyrroline-5-carboxylate reductase
MQQTKITFIGAGNMASCLIGGLINSGYDPQDIWATNPTSIKLQKLAENYHIHTTQNNHFAVEQADIVIFCVKPQGLKEVAIDLAPAIQKHKPLIISIAAGITQQALQTWLGENLPMIRCMPNTPALVSCGTTGLYANNNVTEQQKINAESIFRSVGITLWLTQETDIDKITAISGSGPAYFFLMMEALEQSAIMLGFNSEQAHLLTLQTALGAARLALSNQVDLPTLRQQVTSPGGTTAAAIHLFEQSKIREIFSQAVQAAHQRARELAQNNN